MGTVQRVAEQLLQEPARDGARGGAGGSVGATYVAQSARDGHTLLLGTAAAAKILVEET